MYVKILLCCKSNDIGNHMQLGYTRQNRIVREMTGKPGGVVIDGDVSQHFT